MIGGRFQRPRAMAIDAEDRLYIVDFLARIHVFTAEGGVCPSLADPRLQEWQADRPDHRGGPAAGCRHALLPGPPVHPRRRVGRGRDPRRRPRSGPGRVRLGDDAVRDSTGALYVAEYGGYDRIQKFSPDGEYLLEWGQYGDQPGQFNRPQNLLVDPQDRVWVCDACNHRIQVFDSEGELLFYWGGEGTAPGRLSYPYDIAMDPDGVVYLCEYGNHRVQRLNQEGEPLGVWGSQGRGPGELHNPWSLVLDSQGRLHVLDTYNHRVQRVRV